jgi:hypothetical protein
MVGVLEAVLEDEFKPETNRTGKSIPLREIAELLHGRFLRLRDPNDGHDSWSYPKLLFKTSPQAFRSRYQKPLFGIKAMDIRCRVPRHPRNDDR